MDVFGAGPTGQDGTQAPPPPPVFPDPLAGLVTGVQRYQPEAVAPVVVPPPMPLPQPGPAYVPTTRRPAPPPAQRSGQVAGEPSAHVPHAEPARRQPKPEAVQQGPKKGKSGLIGCLVVLAALSGLLFNVVREIIEAVVDLLR